MMDHPIYKAMTALLEQKSYARLDIGPFNCGELNVGLHAGYEDNALVIGVGEHIDDSAVVFLNDPAEATTARELAAAMLAWADWVDKNDGIDK